MDQNRKEEIINNAVEALKRASPEQRETFIERCVSTFSPKELVEVQRCTKKEMRDRHAGILPPAAAGAGAGSPLPGPSRPRMPSPPTARIDTKREEHKEP